MKIEGTNLSMVRGDTEVIQVKCKDQNGNDVPFVTGDTLYFTVKVSAKTEDKMLQKVITEFENGIALIPINPEDTKSLAIKDYVYDIQLNRANGDVKTIIKKSIFTLEEEVTYE